MSVILTVSLSLTELGVGWGPAFAADTAELEFIEEHQKMSANDLSFWIGGLGEQRLESEGYSKGKLKNVKSQKLSWHFFLLYN